MQSLTVWQHWLWRGHESDTCKACVSVSSAQDRDSTLPADVSGYSSALLSCLQPESAAPAPQKRRVACQQRNACACEAVLHTLVHM